MSSLAEIFRQYGRAYRAKYEKRMPASHRRALVDIEQCRTAALGGQLCYCEHCDEVHYCYHSCQNRHCPQCQHQAGQAWLERQQEWRLPVSYFIRRTIFLWSPSPYRRNSEAWPEVTRS